METFLEQTRANKLQKVLDDFAQARKNNPRSRNQITSKQAVTGRELLLMHLSHVKRPQVSTCKKAPQSEVKKNPKAPPKPSLSQTKASKGSSIKRSKKQAPVEPVDVDSGSVVVDAEEDSVSEVESGSGPECK